MTNKYRSRSLAVSSFIRFPGHNQETGKVSYTYFQRKIAKMAVKVNQKLDYLVAKTA